MVRVVSLSPSIDKTSRDLNKPRTYGKFGVQFQSVNVMKVMHCISIVIILRNITLIIQCTRYLYHFSQDKYEVPERNVERKIKYTYLVSN